MRSRRALIWLILAGTALAAGAFIGPRLLRDDPPGDTRAGAAVAAGLEAGMTAALDVVAPYRCARLHDEALAQASAAVVPPAMGQRPLRLEGHTLRVEPIPRDRTLILGLVADAHGAAEAMQAAHQGFARAGVELVVTLGGMGRHRDELRQVLEPLATDAPWPVLALPGDWEDVTEHRAAVASLRGVLDGSQVRFVEMDGAVLATLPGAPHASRLMAGSDGCLHTAEDAARVATGLMARAGVRVLLAHVPPRQHGPRGSDLGATGIHVGEQLLAEVLAATPIDVVIHGLVEPASAAHQGEQSLAGGAPGGTRPASGQPLALAAGSADPVAGAPGQRGPPRALVVSIGPTRVRWNALPLAP